ncbi:hypothetical protein DFH08DRAFT_803275 [Mycena albidolilacea]|uniref:Uncharacterized protein n=1 Tax=Mycena albidolilacea TaxID=1033008 RepID=A0AAD7ADI3_9AGAR|nr:hypothetical protein DFH08DRAFT_803275 [Mycena albidolilacea]
MCIPSRAASGSETRPEKERGTGGLEPAEDKEIPRQAGAVVVVTEVKRNERVAAIMIHLISPFGSNAVTTSLLTRRRKFAVRTENGWRKESEQYRCVFKEDKYKCSCIRRFTHPMISKWRTQCTRDPRCNHNTRANITEESKVLVGIFAIHLRTIARYPAKESNTIPVTCAQITASDLGSIPERLATQSARAKATQMVVYKEPTPIPPALSP